MYKLVFKKAINIYHLVLAVLAGFYYRFPSRKLIAIGVTGTNGKTTTTHLISHILQYVQNQKQDFYTGHVSSATFKIGKIETINKMKMTMPGRFALQKLLKKMVNAGCKYAVVETTSEGLAQHRAWGIDFKVALFTNLSPEHIESHGSFKNYKKAKAILFKGLDRRKSDTVSIVNLDDKHAGYFLKFKAQKKYGYGLNKSQYKQYQSTLFKKVIAKDLRLNQAGAEFKINKINFKINLLGQFNVYNALAAICAGLSQGMNLVEISYALKAFEGVPGRMEFIQKQPFTVIVDYAHTPEALEKLYQTIKPTITVLGACGGGRDKVKRPILGKIAAQYADVAIITNEDPYDEDPMEIINQVASGAIKSTEECRVLKILDRKLGIKKAFSMAKPGNVVIITGKGCEPWLCAAQGKKISWDDRKIAREELESLSLLDCG